MDATYPWLTKNRRHKLWDKTTIAHAQPPFPVSAKVSFSIEIHASVNSFLCLTAFKWYGFMPRPTSFSKIGGTTTKNKKQKTQKKFPKLSLWEGDLTRLFSTSAPRIGSSTEINGWDRCSGSVAMHHQCQLLLRVLCVLCPHNPDLSLPIYSPVVTASRDERATKCQFGHSDWLVPAESVTKELFIDASCI